MKKITALLAAALTALTLPMASASLLFDGNFQAIGEAQASNQSFYTGTPVAGWQTDNPNGFIEIWDANTVSGYAPPSGTTYFAEMNADVQASLWQIVTAPDSNPFDLYFSHRGRGGVDTAGLSIFSIGSATSWTPGSGTLLYQTLFSTDFTAWSNYSANDVVTPVAGQNYVVVFDSISSASGNPSFGNLLGDVRFGDGVYESGSGITELTPQSFSTSYLSEPIPEPGTWAAAALLVGGAAFMRWRRRQTA
jgi:hypothetical protein